MIITEIKEYKDTRSFLYKVRVQFLLRYFKFARLLKIRKSDSADPNIQDEFDAYYAS